MNRRRTLALTLSLFALAAAAHAQSYPSKPAGMPEPIMAKLSGAVTAALQSPEVQGKLQKLGLDLGPGSPADLGKFLQTDYERWAKTIKQAGIRLE